MRENRSGRRRFAAAISAIGLAVGLSATAVVAEQVVAQAPAAGLDNGLALTPPMGFNDWNAFGCNVSEVLIEQTADFFVSSGMKGAGYDYVNIDDCWMTHTRDAEGRLVPDPVKFPDGIKGTADYVHSKGLKLGIYEDAGTATCAGYPGSLGHEAIDAQTFADWGVDYLKYDNCNNAGSSTKQQYIDRYTAMRDALAATGRPIVYSICEWGVNDPASWAGDVGNLWRTTGDISDNWNSLKSVVNQNAPLAPAAHPGAWNDPDMLEIGNGGMTDTEYRSHFSLWAEMAAPLLVGTDLRKATVATMAIYLNKDVIAVDQDPLGAQGKVISSDGTHLVFAKPLANGDVSVALFNEGDTAATMSTTAAQAGLGKAQAYALTDLWSKKTTETAGRIAAAVPAHGTVLYRRARSQQLGHLPARHRRVRVDTACLPGRTGGHAGRHRQHRYDDVQQHRPYAGHRRRRHAERPVRLDGARSHLGDQRRGEREFDAHHHLDRHAASGDNTGQLRPDRDGELHVGRRHQVRQHQREQSGACAEPAAERNGLRERPAVDKLQQRLGPGRARHEQRRDRSRRRPHHHHRRRHLRQGCRSPRSERGGRLHRHSVRVVQQ